MNSNKLMHVLTHRGVFCVFAVLALLTATLPGQAQGNSCRNIPLSVTFTPMSPGISSDGLGIYVDGQSGVTAQIQMCNGYYDAVIQLGYRSNRRVSYNFNASTVNFIPGLTPLWTQSGSSFLAQPLFNINQIANPTLCPGPACYNPNGNYSFTTYLWNGNITGPDGGTYRLFSVSSNPISDTGFGYVNITPEMVNTPYSTSLVRVTHYAATSTAPETWVVAPVANCSGTCAADQYPGIVSTLLSVVQGKKNTFTTTNVGQFAIPFQMILTRR